MGRIAERILPDSTTTKYEFNQLGALTSLTHSNAGNILDQFKYSHDPAGNITQIEKHRTGINTDNGVFEYAYDPLNRLTQAIKPDGTTKQYNYDPLGNRTSSIYSNGNITTETRHSFNARNQLIKTTEGDIETAYTYDHRGNLTQVTENGQLKHAYTFDATNMMTAAHNPSKGDATYTYNGFRNRVAKLENYNANATAGATTPTIPDPTREIRYVLDMTLPYNNLLMTQGSHNQNFTWGNSLLSATGEDASNTFHYLQDHLGSPIRLLNNDRHGDTLSYDEFGVPDISTSTTQIQPFGFTGYQPDDISGLDYAQARFYTPALGRFTAEDPIKDQQNWYGYCCGNPIAYVDPTGLFFDSWILESIPHDLDGGSYHSTTNNSSNTSNGTTSINIADLLPNPPTTTAPGALYATGVTEREAERANLQSDRFYGDHGFYANAPHYSISGPSLSWDLDKGYGVALFEIRAGMAYLGKETDLLEIISILPDAFSGWIVNDTRVYLFSGDAQAGLRWNFFSDDLIGFDAGVYAARIKTETAYRIPLTNWNLLVGGEADVGSFGLRFGFMDGRLRIGASKFVGAGFSLGLERRDECGE